MAKKEKKEIAEDQVKRFEKAVQDLIDAGELNPTEADEAFERVMQGLRTTPASDHQQ